MKSKLLFVLQLSLLFKMSFSQTITTIGNQGWCIKNLEVTKFRNGDSILNAKTDEEWEKADKNHQPAWCYYENNPSYGIKYGKLYNWYAINDPRGLAPEGFHIASCDEWNILSDFLSKRFDSRFKHYEMKSIRGWDYSKYCHNSTNFSALPGGRRYSEGGFSGGNGIAESAYWWTSTEENLGHWSYSDNAYYSEVSEDYFHAPDCDDKVNTSSKGYGYSVRCIKDKK